MEFEDKTIVMIEPTGAAPVKGKNGWAAKVVYVLEDGTRVDAHLTGRLKRDLLAELATLPAAPVNPTRATFADGKFYGTSTTFGIC